MHGSQVWNFGYVGKWGLVGFAKGPTDQCDAFWSITYHGAPASSPFNTTDSEDTGCANERKQCFALNLLL